MTHIDREREKDLEYKIMEADSDIFFSRRVEEFEQDIVETLDKKGDLVRGTMIKGDEILITSLDHIFTEDDFFKYNVGERIIERYPICDIPINGIDYTLKLSKSFKAEIMDDKIYRKI